MRLDYIDNIDCLEGLRDIPDNSVDLVLTDPPYFLGMTTNGQKGSFNDLAICAPFYRELFAHFARVLKPDTGSLFFFTDWRGYAFYYPLLCDTPPIKNLIVWDKISGPGSFYSFCHEFIVFGTYRPKTKKGVGTNVWRQKAFSSGAGAEDGAKRHPTQKPVALIRKIIEDNTEPGAVVMDTFMGSGTTAVACIKTGRHYIGWEIDEPRWRICQDRVAETIDEMLEEALT